MHECRGTGHRAPTEGLKDCRAGCPPYVTVQEKNKKFLNIEKKHYNYYHSLYNKNQNNLSAYKPANITKKKLK
jgi:hypothetical protein